MSGCFTYGTFLYGTIQIEVADGAVAVPIGDHVGLHSVQNGLLLAAGHQIFEFITLEDHLIFHSCVPP